jgi:hypothetical protein
VFCLIFEVDHYAGQCDAVFGLESLTEPV